MPKYTRVRITCYCGKQHVANVGQSVKCSCGVTLHTQQKRGGGKVWGTLPNGKREQRSRLLKQIQQGNSRLDAQFIES